MAAAKRPNPTVHMLDDNPNTPESWSGPLDEFLKENRGNFSRSELRRLNALRTKPGKVGLGYGGGGSVTITRR